VAELLLFHHALGLTEGCLAFAEELRSAGHLVHTPDLYEGRLFEEIDDGVEHAESVGYETIIERGVRAADGLPEGLIYGGFSLGVLPAQMLAQTRAGAGGALLLYGAEPAEQFGTPWPAEVPLQVHVKDADPWVELDRVNELIAQVPRGELFLYPGEQHLFADRSHRDYDAASAALMTERVLAFLGAGG
jgi:dienelactone hydrolase